MSGTLDTRQGWSVRRLAAISFKAEFLAPLTFTVPLRGLPPRMTNLSLIYISVYLL